MTQTENQMHLPSRENAESILLNIIFKKIIRKWWLFLFIAILGATVGFIYALNQKTIYESYVSFALDEGGSQSGGTGAFSLASQLGITLGGAQDVFTGDNILEIMQSRRMIENTLLSVDTFSGKPMTLIEFYLDDVAKTTNELRNNIHFYPGEVREKYSYSKDSLLHETYLLFKTSNIIATRPDKRLNIYEIMVRSKNEQFTKDFTDKLLDVTNRFYTEISSKKSKETLEILEKRVPAMKRKLNATISNKASIEDANLNPAFAEAQVPLMKEQSNIQVYGTAYAEMFKNLEMARFQYLKSIPLMQIIDAADYPMKRINMGKLKTSIIFSAVATIIFLIIFTFFSFFSIKKL